MNRQINHVTTCMPTEYSFITEFAENLRAMDNLSIPVPFIGLRQACDSHVGARGLWLCAQHLHSNCARRRSTVNARRKTVVFCSGTSLFYQTTQHGSHMVQVVTEHMIGV